jgi:hypothetical protein
MKIAGIDVHKKVLMVVVLDANAPEHKLGYEVTITPINQLAPKPAI